MSEPTAEQVWTIAEGLRKRFAVSNGTQVWVEFQGSAEALADEIADIFTQLQIQAPLGEGLEKAPATEDDDDTFCPDRCDHWATGECPVEPATEDEREGLLKIVTKAHQAAWTDATEYEYAPEAITDMVLAAGYRKRPEVTVEDVARASYEALDQLPGGIGGQALRESWDSIGARLREQYVVSATAVLALINGEES